MRGGKITLHAGAGQGIGGKQFQKGHFVGKRAIEDSLDSSQPLMEMTFFGAGADRTSQQQLMLQQQLGRDENGSPKRNVSPERSGSPQRLVIPTQTVSPPPGSPAKKGSILGSNGDFNVDLQKLTRVNNRNNQPDTPYQSQEFASSSAAAPADGTEKAVVSSRYYLMKSPNGTTLELAQNDQPQQATSSPYFQAMLQQNVATAQRSYSVDSFVTGENQGKRDQYDVFVEETRLDPRPVHTQSVEVGLDSLGTPIAYSNSQSDEMNSSNNLQQQISPILHIQEVDASVRDTANEGNRDSLGGGKDQGSQKSIAYHLPLPKPKPANNKNKLAKVQIFDL